MGTRIFCDQCGNTIRTPRRFKVEEVQFAEAQGIGSSVNLGMQSQQSLRQAILAQAQQAGVSQAPSSSHIPPLFVELCPTCTTTWWERVRNLTKHTTADE